MEKLNPNLLTLAREFCGLTQSELSQKTCIVQGTISKIETGLLEPNNDIVDKISQITGFPNTFFYQRADILPPATPFHRKRQSLSKNLYNKIEAGANLRRLHIERLLESVEINSNIPFSNDSVQTPFETAKVVRRFWKLPKGPIRDLTRVIENAGIFVIEFDFHTDLIDAYTMSTNATNYIFINSRLSGDRYRFSLAHELGHLVMHNYINPEIEQEANEFASEFLMPEDDIRPQLETTKKIEQIAALKPYWKVSIAALIMRISHLNLMTKNQIRYLWMCISRFGWKKREPFQIEREKPTLLQEMLNAHNNELGYSKSELYKLLHVTEELFNNIYNDNDTNKKLTLIK